VVEEKKETLPTYDLTRGRIYIVPDIAYEVFTDQITHGVRRAVYHPLLPRRRSRLPLGIQRRRPSSS